MPYHFEYADNIFGAKVTVRLKLEGGKQSDYDVSVVQEPLDEKTCLVRVSAARKDGTLFTVKNFMAAFGTPLVDIHGMWNCYGDRMPMDQVTWRRESFTAANTGFPFLLLNNRAGQNRMAFGLMDQISETKMTSTMEELAASFEASFEKPLVPDGILTNAFEETVFISRKPAPWYETAAAYVKVCDDAVLNRASSRRHIHIPESAREPVYCTWYAAHHDATADWVERQMETAVGLGFKTLIVDDGWFFDGHGQWGGYGLAGDWDVVDSKFPDFAGHVKRVQAMGAKYLLWVSPFMVGLNSRTYQQMGHLTHPRDHGSFRCYCLRCATTHEHIAAVLKRLMLAYGLDGFKLDFVDAADPLPCTADHAHHFATHGDGVDAALARIRSDLAGINPDVLLEFRQSYANLACRAHSTMFRAGDAPMDADSNLWRISMVRPYAGHFPVHFDPAYWNALETPENVARQMISSVFCVPMLSVDFNKLPPLHPDIIRKWTSFYHRNKKLINFGTFRPNIENAAIESIIMSDGDEAIIGMFRGPLIPSTPAARHIEVLNASNYTGLLPDSAYTGWAYVAEGILGEHISEGRVTLKSIEVPIGGKLILGA